MISYTLSYDDPHQSPHGRRMAWSILRVLWQVVRLPHFPFWLMMAFSTGAILLLMAYHALIGLFSR